ncbi:MAG TPA: hypothetical protein VNZ22_10000 [Bacillota bacterium]|nr:hypothetical protein [Bacillota bacterium]
MPDIKFACPKCQQHILAEPGYAGMQIACPACQCALTVPGIPAAPVPIPVPAYAGAPAPIPPPAPVIGSAPGRAPASAPASAAATGCPSCGAALARGVVLCTKCGYNWTTGQRTVAGRPAPLGKPAADPWATPWYKTPYPYLGALLLVLGTLYYLGRENPAMMLAFVIVAGLYTVGMHIVVTVAAFRESVGTGFLTLCVPFYALYFVVKVSESDTLKVLYSVAILLNLLLRFLPKS